MNMEAKATLTPKQEILNRIAELEEIIASLNLDLCDYNTYILAINDEIANYEEELFELEESIKEIGGN